MAKAIIDYIPKTKREAVRDAYRDEDGYWICLNEGWEATRTDSGCRTIHEDYIADLKYQIAGIQRVKTPIRDADGNELTTDEVKEVRADMVRAFYEEITGEALPVPVEAPQEPVEATAIVPVVNCPPAVVETPEQPQNRLVWYIPTIPYLLALGAVEAVLFMVSVLGVIAEITEVVSPYVIQAVKLGVKVGKDLASFARAWLRGLRESMEWRAELIAEWEPEEWEVA